MEQHSTSKSKRGLVDRLSWLAGVNPERLGRCLGDDRIATGRTALALALSFIFITVVLTAALSVALPEHDSKALVSVAMIMAGLITAIDHSIIQSHWHELGARELQRLEQQDLPSQGTGRTTVLAFRIILSFALSLTVALFFDLLFYDRDIQAELRRVHAATNAAVFERARTMANDEIGEVEAEIQRQLALSNTDLAAALGGSKAAQDKFSRQLAALEADIGRLTTTEGELTRALRLEQENMNAEQTGEPKNPGNSGVEGEGPRFTFHHLQAARMGEELAAVRSELDRKQDARDELPVPPPSGPLPPSIEDRAAKVEDLSAHKRELLAARDQRINSLVEADPVFQPQGDGLLIRLAALEAILNTLLAKVMAVGVLVFVMAMELGGLLAKLMFAVPGAYAVRTAAETRNAAHQAFADMHAVKRDARRARAAEQAADMFDKAMRDVSESRAH